MNIKNKKFFVALVILILSSITFGIIYQIKENYQNNGFEVYIYDSTNSRLTIPIENEIAILRVNSTENNKYLTTDIKRIEFSKNLAAWIGDTEYEILPRLSITFDNGRTKGVRIWNRKTNVYEWNSIYDEYMNGAKIKEYSIRFKSDKDVFMKKSV